MSRFPGRIVGPAARFGIPSGPSHAVFSGHSKIREAIALPAPNPGCDCLAAFVNRDSVLSAVSSGEEALTDDPGEGKWRGVADCAIEPG